MLGACEPSSPPKQEASDYLDALAGICYDGLEGLLYLGLFSLLAALAFSVMICLGLGARKHCATRDRDYDDIDDPFNPQARPITAHNLPRGQLLQLQQRPGQPAPGPDHHQFPRLRVHEPSRAVQRDPALRERAARRKRIPSTRNKLGSPGQGTNPAGEGAS